MSVSQASLIDTTPLGALVAQECCLGQLVEITPDGQALVDYAANHQGLVVARCLEGVSAPSSLPCPVLLFVDHGGSMPPVILGIVRETLSPAGREAAPAASAALPARLVLGAQNQIELRCAKSSITLNSDGKVVIKGSHLVSRSSGPNKIQGASIAIN